MDTNTEFTETELAQFAPERAHMAASQWAYWQLYQAMAGQSVWQVADDPRAAFAAREAQAEGAGASSTDLPREAQRPIDSLAPVGRVLESQVLGLIQAMAAFAPPAAALTTTTVGDRVGIEMQIATDAR